MKKEIESKNQKPMSDQEALAVAAFLVVLLAALWVYKNESAIERFYFNNFEMIYLGGYLLVLGVVGFLIYSLKKGTKKLRQRANLLIPLSQREKGGIPIGKTHDKLPLYLSSEARCSHVQIIGSTGRGKTHSLVVPWILRDLKLGTPVVLIDGKGSPDVPESIKKWSSQFFCPLRILEFDLANPENSIRINPLANGSSQQITDRIFAAFDFEDAYYRSVQYDICGYLVRLIKDSGEVVTFKRLYELLTDDNKLSEAIAGMRNWPHFKFIDSYLRESRSERSKKMAGLISQLSPFAVGEVADLVNAIPRPKDDYDIFVSTEEAERNVILSQLVIDQQFKDFEGGYHNFAIVFSIPTLIYQKMGHQLGKLLLQELAWAIGEREKLKRKKFTSVFLDEFSEFVYEGFVSVLNKARSTQVALHLSHQSLGDLSRVSEDFATSVNTNTNIKCLLGLNDPVTSDFFAKHIGTKSSEKFTKQMRQEGILSGYDPTGQASLREVESYKVHPNTLKEFYNGSGVIHLPTKYGVVSEVIQFEPFSVREVTGW